MFYIRKTRYLFYSLTLWFFFTSANTMIRVWIFISVWASLSFAQDGPPCETLWNIDNCVCDDDLASEVRFPPLCRFWYRAHVAQCTCRDGSEWTPPPGPCEDGSHDVVFCGYDEENSKWSCTCEDGSVFEPKMNRGRKGF